MSVDLYFRIRRCSPHEPWCKNPSVTNLEHYDGHHSDLDRAVRGVARQLAEAHATIKGLREALLRYGVHQDDCQPLSCLCGLLEALAAPSTTAPAAPERSDGQ